MSDKFGQNIFNKDKQDWRPFADRLTKLARAEGTNNFLGEAFAFLNDFITIDSCALFKVAADKKTGAQHLCTFGALDSELAELLAQDYIANGFKNDPMVQTALLSPNVRVRRLPRSDYSPAYRSQYFKKAKLIDKVTSIHMSKDVLFLVNFYRVEQHGTFSHQDFRDLERLAPIIGRFVLRHTQLTQGKDGLSESYAQKITRLINDNTLSFAALSNRERQICIDILLAHEEKDIAHNLGLSPNTVITYRRRIYDKLNIRSKAELFQMALIALT